MSLSTTSESTGLPIFSAGIIPNSSKLSNYCAASSFYDPAECSSFLNVSALQSAIQNECVGKDVCKIANVQSYVNKSDPKFNPEECNGPKSLVFLQIACTIPEDAVVDR